MNKKIVLILILMAVIVSGCEVKKIEEKPIEYSTDYDLISLGIAYDRGDLYYVVEYLDKDNTVKKFGEDWNNRVVRVISNDTKVTLVRKDDGKLYWTVYTPKDYKIGGIQATYSYGKGATGNSQIIYN